MRLSELISGLEAVRAQRGDFDISVEAGLVSLARSIPDLGCGLSGDMALINNFWRLRMSLDVNGLRSASIIMTGTPGDMGTLLGLSSRYRPDCAAKDITELTSSGSVAHSVYASGISAYCSWMEKARVGKLN